MINNIVKNFLWNTHCIVHQIEIGIVPRNRARKRIRKTRRNRTYKWNKNEGIVPSNKSENHRVRYRSIGQPSELTYFNPCNPLPTLIPNPSGMQNEPSTLKVEGKENDEMILNRVVNRANGIKGKESHQMLFSLERDKYMVTSIPESPDLYFPPVSPLSGLWDI